MPTLNELAYEVWEIVRRNIVDDDEIDIRLIRRMIIDQRELWLSRQLNKGELTETGAGGTGSGALYGYERYIQTESCRALEKFDCTNPVEPCMDTMYLATTAVALDETIHFPDLLTLKGAPAIIRIVPCSCPFNIKIDFGSFDRARYGGNGRFNTNQVFAFLRDQQSVFACKDETIIDALTSVTIDGIFADPTQLTNYSEDEAFPIDGKNWEYMLPEIVKKLQIKLNALEDKTNDAQDQELQTDG